MSVAPQFQDELPRLVQKLLSQLGEDPGREGLLDTPERVARSLRSLTDGYNQDARDAVGDALFDQDYDEMVVVKDIPSTASASTTCCRSSASRTWPTRPRAGSSA
jgi:GTP cyclohydrolase I